MRKVVIVVVSTLACLLTGCSTVAFAGNKEKVANFVYDPIALSKDNLTILSDSGEIPGAVLEECFGVEVKDEVEFGGGATIIFDWLAGKMIGGLRKRVAAAVKKYSAEQSTKETYLEFYDSTHWRDESNQSGQVSCFVASRQTCAKADSKDGFCPPRANINLAIIGQYRRTDEYLQVRPLWVYKQGMSAKFTEGADASIAATLAITSVWTAGGRGYKETILQTPLYSAKFKAATAGQSLKVTIPKWADVPYQPLPPHSNKITGHSAPVVTVAESSVPPKKLKWLQSFLDDQKDDLSDSLQESLEKLLD